MANRVETFRILVPAGILAAKPKAFDLSFKAGIVREVQFVVPDGHCGLTGIRLTMAHQPLLPITDDGWLTSNDEIVRWPLENFLDTGAWGAEAYNRDVYHHNFFVRFLVDEPGAKGRQPPFAGPGGAIQDEHIEAGGTEPEPEPPTGPGGEPEPEPSPEPEPEPSPEPEPPAEAPPPEEPETAEPESPEAGEEGEVSGSEPAKTVGGWVAAAFWHGKGHKRRLWWFYGTPEAAERYRKAHHLKWVFYGTLAQGRAWQAKHVKAGHKPKPGHKPRPHHKRSPAPTPRPKPAPKPKPRPKPKPAPRPKRKR